MIFDVKNKTRVVLADDHAIMRFGVRKILEKYPDIELVAEAENGREALNRINENQPDLLILDIEMPEVSGIEVAKYLYEHKSTVRVLVMSTYDDMELISSMLSYGVKGYLLKDDAPDALIEAIRKITHDQEPFFSQRIALRLS